jgi:FtsH-binding integral membrane protein
MNKTLVGIIVGLMIATSAVYFVEASEELFEDQDMIKGPFFVIVATAYIVIAIWTVRKENSTHIIVALAGTIGLMALYAISVTEMASILGMEAGNIGHMGMVSKVLQTGIVFGAIVALIQSKKGTWLKPKQI